MPNNSLLDRDVSVLRAAAREWVTTPLAQKRELLVALSRNVADVAEEWVRVSCQGKGIPTDSPLAGEEWMSGPYSMLGNATALAETLETLEQDKNPLDKVKVRTLPSGHTALRVYPYTAQDALLLPGYRGDIWLRPGVTLEQAKAGVARRLLDTSLPGEVALILGAGNINSIPPLDALHKLYADNAVVLVKLNPVNAYLEPVLTRAFAPFIERGFVRITSGGADVGSYLTQHADVDTIHITGSVASHDAIVFGPGEEGTRRKAERRPLITKPVTSELGNVGPVIVLPGRYSNGALRFAAEHVATHRLHNSGFNCVASQVVVLSDSWPQADRFLDYLRQALRDAPVRPAYYPGAANRQRQAVETYPKAELCGGDESAPRTLLTDLDPRNENEPAFQAEYFSPVLGVTSLPGVTIEEFLDNAVDFCNERLYGTLGANVIGAPFTLWPLKPAHQKMIARLRYGTIAINSWVGLAYALPRGVWGAFPGHDVFDVGSGVGMVHNALLLDEAHIERCVVQAPFHPRPKPPWFVDNRTAHITGERMTRFAAEPSLPKVTSAFVATLRG